MKHKLSFGCRSKCPQQEAEGSSVAPWWHHKQKRLLWLHSQRTLRTDCAAAESSEPRSTRTAHSGRAASSDWPRFNGQCTKWQQQSLQLVSRREKHASALGQGLHRSSALSAGHIVRVRHSSLLWKLAGEFNQKVTFHQDFFFFLIRKCQCEWNLWVFFLCVWLVMLILLEHFSGKESSFQNNSWDRRGPWPSEVVPGCGKAHSLFPHCLLQSRAGLLTCQATTPAAGLLRNWKCVGERMGRKGASILCL